MKTEIPEDYVTSTSTPETPSVIYGIKAEKGDAEQLEDDNKPEEEKPESCYTRQTAIIAVMILCF